VTPFLRKLTWWRQRRRREEELREELQFHLAEEADERQADGISEDEAKWAARRDLGNVTMLREEARSLWSWMLLEQLAQDLRYGLRMMGASKTFSAMAILSLALGIGANTAIYSFMDSLLLRSLPVSNPESLAVLNWRAQSGFRLANLQSRSCRHPLLASDADQHDERFDAHTSVVVSTASRAGQVRSRDRQAGKLVRNLPGGHADRRERRDVSAVWSSGGCARTRDRERNLALRAARRTRLVPRCHVLAR